MSAIARLFRPTPLIEPRSVAAGVLAAVALLGVYLGIISLAQGIEHALEQLGTDALFVGLIAAGFGTQIALFVELRAVDRLHRSAAAVTAAGTGTSAAAMLACLRTSPGRPAAAPGSLGGGGLPECLPDAALPGLDRDEPDRDRRHRSSAPTGPPGLRRH